MTDLLKSAKRLVKEAGLLPPHPYPEQFSQTMDCPLRDWADRFYLIASTPRCGSHFLGHAMIENGTLGVPLEYLNRGNAYYWKRRFGTSDLKTLFGHFVRHRTAPSGWFGFKAHWTQFRPFAERMDALTKGVGLTQVLHIRRRDRLAQAVSFVIAQQTGAWISGARTWRKPRFDYAAIVTAAEGERRENDAWCQWMAQHAPERHATVVFEDLRATPDTAFSAIAQGLGATGPLAPPQRTRQQSNSINKHWIHRFRDSVQSTDRWILEPAV